MKSLSWVGVFPAITTPFREDLSIDEELLRRHVAWLLEHGCRGIVANGSLGEAATLTFAEKIRILEICREVAGGRVPVVAGISGLATAECVALARAAAEAGSDALMVLPPYVYRGDWRETEAHFSAILDATSLPCMLYNNPGAYGTDIHAAEVEALCARHENLQAVKESSGDVRRVTALLERLGDRVAVFAGLDDMVVEAVAMGASGWVAGLVNAFPAESVRLFELANRGARKEARELYEWFLPLLRFDTVPKFVQLIKLVQAEVGWGRPIVRPPRLPLQDAELASAMGIIRSRMAEIPGA
ncbi:MAG: dihydrodipicolinate synthase family protein [Gemmatimonadetes bacterium]|nr:dihydrodipicolinate synthase family protein [Gemmatimonadota bacterium]